eukprot:4895300-Pyramimonas_sp.AAC.3
MAFLRQLAVSSKRLATSTLKAQCPLRQTALPAFGTQHVQLARFSSKPSQMDLIKQGRSFPFSRRACWRCVAAREERCGNRGCQEESRGDRLGSRVLFMYLHIARSEKYGWVTPNVDPDREPYGSFQSLYTSHHIIRQTAGTNRSQFVANSKSAALYCLHDVPRDRSHRYAPGLVLSIVMIRGSLPGSSQAWASGRGQK